MIDQSVNLQELIRDIQAGIDDSLLQQRYCFSRTDLQTFVTDLIQAKIVSVPEPPAASGPVADPERGADPGKLSNPRDQAY